jgi:hypothetical protein
MARTELQMALEMHRVQHERANRLEAELRRYRVDDNAWREWVYDILTDTTQRYGTNRNDCIASGLIRSVAAEIHKFRLANYRDDNLVLLVPEGGWGSIEEFHGEPEATLYGIKTRAVAGLEWPMIGIELTRERPRD